ncbi:ABC transporter permease [Streptococcus suis]|uniref:ABC transporter permease n=1 Tax=Streptococcus suis TaxID=1307 RepID=UPI0003F5BAB5|nr:ABC transporter permease [Streptococcus suis]HEM3231945.1 ABC transporter permease [Streptococcus suis 2726]HEM3232259.1 ABC transporter permease [Streptococcus suis 2726]HEM4075479.1 ABC transporter permease [Streptococcus suis]HEM4076264.1 ABC transporter permease [Streptococcus suis]
MIKLELKKLKRRKIFATLVLVCFISAIIQYIMGNMTYHGVKYGEDVGWFLKNGLTINSYYLFIPIFTLTGMELFLAEERNHTYNNILTTSVNKIKLIKAKISLMFIISISYSVMTLLLMILMEIKLNYYSFSLELCGQYLARYLIHGLISCIISATIVSMMLYYKQSLQTAVTVGFILSFIGVFISQLDMAYLYLVNGMFYLSNSIFSNGLERAISFLMILPVFALLFCYMSSYSKMS